MQNKKTCSVVDVFNMVRSVIRFDAKDMHKVQIITSNKQNLDKVHDFMNWYEIATTENSTGLIVDMSQRMSIPARKMMEHLCRLRGNGSNDIIMPARFQRDMSLTDISAARIKTFHDVAAKRDTIMQERFYSDMAR